MPKFRQREKEKKDFEEEVIQIDRVTRVVKGGRRLRFRATVAIGDKKGKVGVGLGKAPDVAGAIKKGVSIAKKHIIEAPIINGTIPFEYNIKLGAAKVLLKPAPPGSGVIAGGAVRSVVAAAGIQNISSKVLGTKNQASNVYATIEALKRLAERYRRHKKPAI